MIIYSQDDLVLLWATGLLDGYLQRSPRVSRGVTEHSCGTFIMHFQCEGGGRGDAGFGQRSGETVTLLSLNPHSGHLVFTESA